MKAGFAQRVGNPRSRSLQDRAFDFVAGVARAPDVGADLRDTGIHGLRSDMLDRVSIARAGKEVFRLDVDGVGIQRDPRCRNAQGPAHGDPGRLVVGPVEHMQYPSLAVVPRPDEDAVAGCGFYEARNAELGPATIRQGSRRLGPRIDDGLR